MSNVRSLEEGVFVLPFVAGLSFKSERRERAQVSKREVRSLAAVCTVCRPSPRKTRMSATIPSGAFYNEYFGHPVEHLEILHGHLQSLKSESQYTIWFAGDSTLDNKYWLADRVSAPAAYRSILTPPVCRPDIAYHLSNAAEGHAYVINCAVEGTTVARRTHCLLPQDELIRDNIRSGDVLVVSVGGNDIVLQPSLRTVLSMIAMLTNKTQTLDQRPLHARGLSWLIHIFRDGVKRYIEQLTAETMPALVIVCMVYYPDENRTPSWAGGPLKIIYDGNPAKLQAAIRGVYKHATSEIQLPGTRVEPVAFFDMLDSKDSADYVARVEPSSIGGEKMAQGLWQKISEQIPGDTATGPSH